MTGKNILPAAKRRGKTFLLLLACLICITGCQNEKTANLSGAQSFGSYLDIPGITDAEILAVESLQSRYDSFSFGMVPSNEAFRKNDGTIGGYTALFCDWLTELFKIPFKVELYPTGELFEKIENGELDFTGMMAPTESRNETSIMTDTIAERKFITVRLKDSPALNRIARPRYAAPASTPVADIIASALEDGSFEIIAADDYQEAYALLKDNIADAYVATSAVETAFSGYDDLIIEDFYPLIFNPASMGTSRSRPELEVIIRLVNKALRSGANFHLLEMYKQGYRDYQKHAVSERLTDEERIYIAQNPVIPVLAFTVNYPLCFYNTRENEWQGIYFDLLDEITNLTGIVFQVGHDRNEPYLESLQRLLNRELLMAPEMLPSAINRQNFLLSDYLILDDYYALISRADFPNISLNEVIHNKIGAAAGTTHAGMFRQWFPNHTNITEYPDIETAFNALQNREVDLVMSTQRRLMYLTHFLEQTGYKTNIIFNQHIETRLAVHRDEAVLLGIIDKALRLIDINSITSQWTQRTYDYRKKIAEAQLPWLIGAISMSLLVITLVMIILYKNRRVSVEKAVMRESEERVSMILDSAPFSINLIDGNYKCIVVNEEAVRLYGLKNKQEYLDMFSTGRLSEQKGAPNLQKAFKDGYWRGEMTFLKPPNDEKIPCELTLIRINYKDDYVIAAYARDLREKKAAMEKIHETQEQKRIIEETHHSLKKLLDMLPTGIVITSRSEGKMLYANDAVLDIFNVKSFEEDIAGRSISGFLQEQQPDGRKASDLISHGWSKDKGTYELYCNRATGEKFWIRGAYCHINYEGQKAILNAIEDMTAEKEYQQMLINTALKEQEANQLKSRFLANMSHEIRTPMNAIIGMTELALREHEQHTKNELIHTVKQAASNLLAIINDILDFSKIEAGKLDIVTEDYSVPSLLNDVISIIRMRVIDSQIRFAVKADSRIPHTLNGDETRIRQAVLNVLSNAVKYTESGFVSLGVYAEFLNEDTVNLSFEIKDSGIGIKPEDMDRLFNDFTQLDLEKNRNIEGVGLGLAITKRIIEAMDGKISVSSDYGVGSTFVISLPQKFKSREGIAKVEEPRKKSALVFERRDIYAESLLYTLENLGVNCTFVFNGTQLYEEMEKCSYDYLFLSSVLVNRNDETIYKFGQNTKTVILAEFGEVISPKLENILTMPAYCCQIASIINGVYSEASYTEIGESIVKFSAPEARVLVVDDVNTNLKVAQGLLSPYNMRIDLCGSGKAAIEAVKSEQYDLVFMDHKMPVMDGVEAVRRIRAWENENKSIRHIPIIALTANAVSGMMEMFFENGFNGFLSKPIDTVQLNIILEKWIPKEKQERK